MSSFIHNVNVCANNVDIIENVSDNMVTLKVLPIDTVVSMSTAINTVNANKANIDAVAAIDINDFDTLIGVSADLLPLVSLDPGILTDVADVADKIESVYTSTEDAANSATIASAAEEGAKASVALACALANIEWGTASFVDGELVFTYFDSSASTPTLDDGELILTY